MRRMQAIQGNSLTHHIQLIFLQLRQRSTVGDMTDRNMHSLRFNQAQRLLKAFKLIGSILLIIGVGSRKVTEHALNIDTGQGRCQLGKSAGITHMHTDTVHTCINLNMYFSLRMQLQSRRIQSI